ncbi:DNA polymerase III subunit gamma and tau, partial [Streptomyces sp. NPDC059010]
APPPPRAPLRRGAAAQPAARVGGPRRPGGWPTATPAGSGTQPAPPSSGAPTPAPGPQPTAPPSAPPADAAPAYAPPSGGLDPRMLWPNILEAVKNRRRFTWILLSQNAHVAGFDGTTLQLGFVNAGARDNFASSGSEDVLRQSLAEQFNVQWKIEAIIDPSGGGSAPPPTGGSSGFGGGGGGGYGGAGTGGYGAGGNAGNSGYGGGGGGGTTAQRPSPPQSTSTAPTPPPTASSAPAPTAAPTPASRPSSAPEPPPPVAPEDDIPEDDDPDLNESALSGYDLIVRELGATVVEEFTNE